MEELTKSNEKKWVLMENDDESENEPVCIFDSVEEAKSTLSELDLLWRECMGDTEAWEARFSFEQGWTIFYLYSIPSSPPRDFIDGWLGYEKKTKEFIEQERRRREEILAERLKRGMQPQRVDQEFRFKEDLSPEEFAKLAQKYSQKLVLPKDPNQWKNL